MRGKRISDEKREEIKALSIVYNPRTIADKIGVGLRTIYEVLKKPDSPAVEARREERRVEVVDKVWDSKEVEVTKIKSKMDMLLNHMDEEKAARARLSKLSIAFGTLFDKRQLLTGKSTQNLSLMAQIVTSAAARHNKKDK